MAEENRENCSDGVRFMFASNFTLSGRRSVNHFQTKRPKLVKTKSAPTKTACDLTFRHYKFCSNFNVGTVMTQNRPR